MAQEIPERSLTGTESGIREVQIGTLVVTIGM
jgi:hypothetical protein